MSEMNGSEVVKQHTFTFEGKTGDPPRVLTAFLYDLKADLDDLRQELTPKEGDLDASGNQKVLLHRDFCTSMQKMVQEKYGVAISRGEADYLIDRIDIEYTKKKRSAGDEWRSAARLPPSTTDNPSATHS